MLRLMLCYEDYKYYVPRAGNSGAVTMVESPELLTRKRRRGVGVVAVDVV